MESQNRIILKHMKEFGSITAYDAFKHYRILRLSARIWDLKHDGYDIGSTMEYENDKKYARYFLKGESNAISI